MPNDAPPQPTDRWPEWLTRPDAQAGVATVAQFDDLLDRAITDGPNRPIDYQLPYPKWQFLCHVADSGRGVLHGSGAPDIDVFEPRQSNDTREFGNRRAVYAASDGIWPMFFAIVDRARFPHMSINNGCVRIRHGDSSPPESRYFFSIDGEIRDQQPWRRGTVYLLPSQGFELDTIDGLDDDIESAQVASLQEVIPLAKLTVDPSDFPFLQAIRAHDPAIVMARAAADPGGFPWLDA